jgi:quercetin dioxygenase-like cupin family protein
MAIALTPKAGPTCQSEAEPAAVLELCEAPDSVRQPSTSRELQTTLHVLDGIVYVAAGEDDWVLTPGDTATVDPGQAYRRWNAGDGEACWVEVYCAS